jgi:hypothetical protein
MGCFPAQHAPFFLHTPRESGCDAFTIKQLAGHASILISQRYVHPTPARLENAIGALEASTKTAVEAVQ